MSLREGGGRAGPGTGRGALKARAARIGYFLIGAGLLALAVHEADLAEVGQRIHRVGWGFAALLAIHLFAFLLDVGAWQATLERVPVTARWLYRLWKLRMVGAAFSDTTPLATFGGEPVKAYLLNRLYGVSYREGVASLVISRTIMLLSLVAFLCVGFAAMAAAPALDPAFKVTAGLGLLALGGGIGAFFLLQHGRIATRALRRLSRGRWAERLRRATGHVHEFETRVKRFYTRRRGRFSVAWSLSLGNEFVNVLELYVAAALLGHPLSLMEALVIETAAQLARSAAFLIPGRLGAQDGAYVVACAALTGSPALGLAVALLRRLREVVWIGWGFALGWGAMPRAAGAS